MNNKNEKVLRKFALVSLSPGFMSTTLACGLAKVPFYKYIPVAKLFLLLIKLYIKT
jgi:hypothetical protein